MRMRTIVLVLMALLAAGVPAGAQQQTGEIFGKVTDQSGAVMPGVTVTLTAPVLLQPLVAVTGETGTYQFPRLDIGVYTVSFALAGFRTTITENVRVTVGFSAQINAQLAVSTVQETVTVSGESPIVDTKATGTSQTFTNDLLQGIPSARGRTLPSRTTSRPCSRLACSSSAFASRGSDHGDMHERQPPFAGLSPSRRSPS
jgi:Carboxypeptidase regulatory-like domain